MWSWCAVLVHLLHSIAKEASIALSALQSRPIHHFTHATDMRWTDVAHQQDSHHNQHAANRHTGGTTGGGMEP